jgi:NAD-dependent dihydropyrimidine dehydrogenase PreA subunit
MRESATLLWVTVIQTLLRMLPFPCRTGLIRIGHPDATSPVLLTGNFRLTVERVKRSLRGVDAYLLIANSRGVNVWCAATGGLLSNHDVVSVIKTSGIEHVVNHRTLVLPQLAATGIESRVVHRKTGWHVVWGPVRADDLPAFIDTGLTASPAMRNVEFPWTQRLEMAVAWAFPISLIAALLALPFFGWSALALGTLIWIASLAIFLPFPLYEHRLRRKETNVGFVFFDFGRTGLPILMWLLFLVVLAVVGAITGDLSSTFMLRWGIASLGVLLILSLDLTGSTPRYKSGLHEDRLLAIELDEERCKGAGSCEQVCPTRVFEIDTERRLATLPKAADCVQCGACIVQCPFDALSFRSPTGERIGPDTVRRFKLNLIGTRAGASASDSARPQ